MVVFYCNGKKGICDCSTICADCDFFDESGGKYIKDDNPYWERICKLSAKQRAKGLETYGQGLESNPAAMQKRIEHLQEELIDALMYCEWMKDKLTEMEGENHGNLSE